MAEDCFDRRLHGSISTFSEIKESPVTPNLGGANESNDNVIYVKPDAIFGILLSLHHIAVRGFLFGSGRVVQIRFAHAGFFTAGRSWVTTCP